jgi:hypothetical protein
MSSPIKKQLVDRMRNRFANSSRYTQVWDDLWKDRTTPWDLGRPTPALASELVEAYGDTPQHQQILVPGCGAGYDLVTLANHFDKSVVVGLDVSVESLQVAAARLEQDTKDLSTSSSIQLVMGDFFEDPRQWKTVYSTNKEEAANPYVYDLIFDYTFFCALPPSLRKDWGETTSKLLHADTGRLLTLMFPLIAHDNEALKGPPYPVQPEDYIRVLEPQGVFQEMQPFPSPDTVPQRKGQELVCWWQRQQSKL